MEIWISYRGIKTSLNDGMSEKAEATAKRIEQSMAELERQISWVTRAYSDDAASCAAPTMRNCCGRCRRSASSRMLDAAGPRAASPVAHARSRSAAMPTSPAICSFTEAVRARHQLRAGVFPRASSRIMSIALSHSGFNAASPSPRSISASSPTSSATAQVGKVGVCLCRRSPRARCWRIRPRGPEIGEGSCERCRRSLPLIAAAQCVLAAGTDSQRPFGADDVERRAKAWLARVLRAADGAGADTDPRSTGAHRLLMIFGFVVAIVAGTIMRAACWCRSPPSTLAHGGSALAILAIGSRSGPRTNWKSSPSS